MTRPLPGDVLGLLSHAREIQIETRVAQDVPPHRTTIWVVVDDAGRALIRTYRGPGSRWYRQATDQGIVTILAGGQAIRVKVEPAGDPERIAACSLALQHKYADSPSMAAMLDERNLPTTLELRLPDDPVEGRRGEGS